VGHTDPRPPDWAKLDRQCYSFLVRQMSQARQGRGHLDVAGLSRQEQLDLWEFARHEADRQGRQIDYFSGPESGIRGETADYLVGNHKLLGRFYTHLAGQLEAILPVEDVEAAKAWD